MGWHNFIWFAAPAVLCWLAAGIAVWFRGGRRAAEISMTAGTIILALFIANLWIVQGRPPLRTMGETRLWYSLFTGVVGYIAYKRHGYPWLLSFAAAMPVVFNMINLLKPAIHHAGLMPALQSVWFVPHVAVYMLSYAMFAAAAVGACVQLWNLSRSRPDAKLYGFTDSMVSSGFGLLSLGMLMGMVWAKEAWGHYWEWDPKETWALATVLVCLVHIHMRRYGHAPKFTMWMLPVAFALLMITWIGVNYLPSAQGSMHVY